MAPEVISDLMFFVGLCFLWWRLQRKPFTFKKNQNHGIELPSLTKELAIIIPARNEQNSLPRLLHSLKDFINEGGTVLVVDDQSEDETAKVASQHGALVISTPAKPKDWAGKNWACHQGAEHLVNIQHSSRYWLFTDADTTHSIQKIKGALQWFKEQNAQVLTALPFHKTESLWEKVTGPFHIMVATVTDAFQTQPTPQRYFSIGQFLLFEREYYIKSGGHLIVREELAEDLALAKICFNLNGKFLVFPKAELYSVRMYDSFKEFIKGWSRNFRLGMKHSHWWTWIEIFTIFGTCLGIKSLFQYILVALIFLWRQRKLGQFSVWGALFYPLGLLLFILVSLLSAVQTLSKKPIQWKSREYSI